MESNRRDVRRILVALDTADGASCLMEADHIARAFDAGLRVLHVLPAAALASDVQRESSALADRVSEDTKREGSGFQASVLLGDPLTRILEQAQKEEVDLVVVGTHERQGLDRWASVSGAVVRDASCSVLVSRSSSPTRGPVLVACDLGPNIGDVLSTGAVFARRLGESLVALHAVEPRRHDAVLIANAVLSGTVSPPPDPSSVQAFATVAESALHVELAAAGVDGRPEVAVGTAAELIVRRARELRASLIVVGTNDWGAIGRLILGSVGMTVARDAHCSVLVVRPPPEVDAQDAVRKRDALSAAATELVEGAVGAAAGAVAGILAGPVGMLAGATIGAAAALALGRRSEGEEHEAALHQRELDAIDAEHEFFARRDEDEVPTNRNPLPLSSQR